MSTQNNTSNTSNSNRGGSDILKHGWGPRVTPAPLPTKPPKTK